MKRWPWVIAAVGALVVTSPSIAEPAPNPDTTRVPQLRFRPVLAEFPPAPHGTPPADEATKAAIASCQPSGIPNPQAVPNTTAADDKRDACVVLPNRAQEKQPVRYFLGPAALTAKDVRGAKPEFAQGQGYAVSFKLKRSGSKKINQLAAQCTARQANCPTNQMAIVLDGVVQSAPQFQTANFGSGPVQITGSFTSAEASNLANTLNRGR